MEPSTSNEKLSPETNATESKVSEERRSQSRSKRLESSEVGNITEEEYCQSVTLQRELKKLMFENPGDAMVARPIIRQTPSRPKRVAAVKQYAASAKDYRPHHDRHGHLMTSRGRAIDLCDCLDVECSGCHRPCRKCNSQKCSFQCRCGRATVVEQDGGMEPLLMNGEPQDMDDGAESQKALTNVKKQSGLERPVGVEVCQEQTTEMKNGLLYGGTIKAAILVWLAFQNSVHTLLLRYSRVRPVPHMFYSSVAVFWMEVFKVFFCLVMVFMDSGELTRSLWSIRKQVFNQPWDTLKVCIPAMLYTLQNNFFYTAASHLDAATFMIVSQLKIFSTAMFSILLLNRRLMAAQWLALTMLFFGVCMIQFHSDASSHKPAKATTDALKTADDVSEGQQPLIGFIAACLACTISGFAGVFFERILKGSTSVSVWMRNIQMSLFAVPCSFVASMIQDGYAISRNGFLYGFDAVVWFTVLWYCIGGLSVAVCIKYADNIAKNFATSVAIILATVGSIYIFDFAPDGFFLIGASLVILSIFLYSSSAPLLQWIQQRRRVTSSLSGDKYIA